MADFEIVNRQKACRHGQMLFNIHDQYVGRSLELYGEYSEGEAKVFGQILKPGQVVVEAGANIGAHTVCLAQRVGPTGQVWAFEPQRLLFQILCGNLALNSISNVRCAQQAVGAKAGSITVPMINYHVRSNFGGLALGKYDVGESVPLITLDSLNLPRCHFIKADVEGMEQQVLEGAVDTIARHKPILYVENEIRDNSDDLIRFIDSLDYNLYWHKPFYFQSDNFFSNSDNVFPNLVSMNMLCVPKNLPQALDVEPVKIPPPAEPKS